MLNAICTQNENFYYGIWIWGPRGKIDLAIEELNTERPMLVFFLVCYGPILIWISKPATAIPGRYSVR